MFKRVLLILLVLLLLTTVACGKKNEETVSSEETTMETTEMTIPGLEDSIFDDVVIESDEKAPVAQIPAAGESTVPEATEELPAPGEMDYETFQSMAPSRQRTYQESFESIDAFYDWYEAAKAAYDQAHAPIEIVDGVVDMSKIIED